VKEFRKSVKASNSVNFAQIGRALSEITELEPLVKTGWFRQLRSSKVVKNGTIRQNTYDFLFEFESYYMPISFRFGDA